MSSRTSAPSRSPTASATLALVGDGDGGAEAARLDEVERELG